MKAHESEKFEKYGSFFPLFLVGVGVILPFVVSLIWCIVTGTFRWDVVLAMGLIYMFFAWLFIIMAIAYGKLLTPFIKRTAKGIGSIPYRFNSSFQSRAGILYIAVEDGMIAFISSYNPMKIQVFNASRLDKIQSISSGATGIRFVFYLDGKKITMPTLLTNRIVSTTSGIGAEAVSKADTYAQLLLAAKHQAETN